MMSASLKTEDMLENDLKAEHKRLAAVIKDVHKQLRRNFRESGGDHSAVWEEHLQNSAVLQNYAHAMQQLATHHWASHPDTRIEWCRQTAVDYFKNGGLQRALRRDARKKRIGNKCHSTVTNKNKTDLAVAEDSKVNDNNMSVKYLETNDGKEPEKWQSSSVAGQIRLLDVGSCYNPFLDFPEFDSIAVDLSPANKNVYQCDFLKLAVVTRESEPSLSSQCEPAHSSCSDPCSRVPPSCLTALTPEKTPLESPSLSTFDSVSHLPGESFEVVVFSLLLEYLPAPAQRWTCCVNAQALLVTHGLLLIVTPDSNSAYRNHPMMRSWREALGHLGFERWKYHKMEHVHCMAFRKVKGYRGEDLPDSVERLMYIPQDFSDACYKDDHLPDAGVKERGETTARQEKSSEEQAELETFLLHAAGELPSIGSESDSDEEEEKRKCDYKYVQSKH